MRLVHILIIIPILDLVKTLNSNFGIIAILTINCFLIC